MTFGTTLVLRYAATYYVQEHLKLHNSIVFIVWIGGNEREEFLENAKNKISVIAENFQCL